MTYAREFLPIRPDNTDLDELSHIIDLRQLHVYMCMCKGPGLLLAT